MMETREGLAWGLVAFLSLLVLSSFTGTGTGMFGWGWMVGMMWLWMLVPVLLVVALVVYLVRATEPRQAQGDQERRPPP